MLSTYNLGLIQHIKGILSKEGNFNYSKILSKRLGINCITKDSKYSHNIPNLLLITGTYCDNFVKSYVPCDTKVEHLPIFSFNIDAICGTTQQINIDNIIKQVNPLNLDYTKINIKIKDNPSHGTITIFENIINYKSEEGYNDIDYFTFYLANGDIAISSIAKVTINVKCCEPIPPGFSTFCSI